MKQPTIVLRTTVEFGMGNYLGLYQITKDVSFYKCHNVYISSSLWFWWKWSWKFLVCFIVFPLPSEVQKLDYYLLVFYFKDCLFAFRNHYENKSRFYPCLNHHFQKDILCWLFAIFPNSLQRVWLIFKRLFPKPSTLPHAQCLSFPEQHCCRPIGDSIRRIQVSCGPDLPIPRHDSGSRLLSLSLSPRPAPCPQHSYAVPKPLLTSA